ncbi:MAG: nitrilase-related carbon-nitrogen hydrolase [Planctomycetota bacterium]
MKKEYTNTPVQVDHFSYLWLAIGTLLGFFWTIPLTMWFGAVFILRFMRTQKLWRGFILVWLSGYVTLGITLRDMLPLPLPMYLVSMAISALTVGALPYLADRLLAHRLKGFASTLVFPLAVTAMDFISATTSPMGSLGAYAYALNDNLVLLQLLSVTGMWGITFLVSWFASVVNWAWEHSSAWPEIRRGAAIYTGVLLVVMLYGSARLTFGPLVTGTVRVHGFTAVDMRKNWGELNRIIAQEGWQAMRQKTAEYHNLYFEGTVREARAGAQIVHWPEMAVMVAKEDEPAFIARAQQIAHEESIYLAMAMGTVYQDGSSPWENKLIIVDPAGETVLEHYKYGGQMFEGSKAGDGVLRTVETPFGKLSGIICWDTDFPETIIQAGRNGTDILLSPSLDYRAIDPMHAYMAIYRAIENGVAVVRQSDNGLSVVTDPYGRVLAAVDHFTASKRVTVAQVPAKAHVFTIYSVIGDLFGWLTVVGFMVIAVWAVVWGRKAT